jgi:hypothetical protein
VTRRWRRPCGSWARPATSWPARLTWRGWLVIAAAVIVAVGVPGYVTFAETRAPLTAGGGSWWFARDAWQSVDASADNAKQVTAPIRSGQEQGFYVFLYNPSDQTQTVLGVAAGYGQSPAQSCWARMHGQSGDLRFLVHSETVRRRSGTLS